MSERGVGEARDKSGRATLRREFMEVIVDVLKQFLRKDPFRHTSTETVFAFTNFLEPHPVTTRDEETK